MVTAVVIIIVMVGLYLASNKFLGNDAREKEFEYTGNELKFEGAKVIDYGVYSDGDIATLVEEFIQEYAEYVEEDKELFLVINKENAGGNNELKYISYRKAVSEININVGGAQGTISVDSDSFTRIISGGGSAITITPSNKLKVNIGDMEREFDYREGQNLFFIIRSEREGEVLVGDSESFDG